MTDSKVVPVEPTDYPPTPFEMRTRDFRAGYMAGFAAAPTPEQWQDISTAPKDGTVIDFWHEAGFRIPDHYWIVAWEYWEHEDVPVGASDGLVMDEITHWMHRPNPPVLKEQTNE